MSVHHPNRRELGRVAGTAGLDPKRLFISPGLLHGRGQGAASAIVELEQLPVGYFVATIRRVYDLGQTDPGRGMALAGAKPAAASVVLARPAPMHQEGRYLFVHSGICPPARLNQQARHRSSGWQIRKSYDFSGMRRILCIARHRTRVTENNDL